MSFLVVVALVALLALRPASADDRSGGQFVTAARSAGAARCAGRALWAITVVVLIVLASVSTGTGRAVYATASALWMVAAGLAQVVPPPEVRA